MTRNAQDITSEPPQPESRRQRILLAALVLFGERGFAGASVREISSLAGVSPALLWRHYQNKETLQLAVDDYVEQQVIENVSKLDIADRQTWIQAYLPTDTLNYLKRGLVEPTERSMSLWQKLYNISMDYNRIAVREGQFRSDVDLHQLTMHILSNVMLTPLFTPLMNRIASSSVSVEQMFEQQVAFEFALWNDGMRAVDHEGS